MDKALICGRDLSGAIKSLEETSTAVAVNLSATSQNRPGDSFVVDLPGGSYAWMDAGTVFVSSAKGVPALGSDLSQAFGTSKLVNIDLSGFDMSAAVDLRGMFYCCEDLVQIVFPASFQNAPRRVLQLYVLWLPQT